MKGLGSVVNGTTLLVKELDETEVRQVTPSGRMHLHWLIVVTGKNQMRVCRQKNVGSIAPVENNEDYVQLKFSHIGWYKLYLTNRTDSDEITIEVGYKDLGFYTTEKKDTGRCN